MRDVNRDVERAALAVFGGDEMLRGLVVDAGVIDGRTRLRYVAVVRTPTGAMLLGEHELRVDAQREVARFWDGMRALLAPAEVE